MPKSSSFSPQSEGVPLSLASILLFEVDPELRSTRHLLLSSLEHPVLAICSYAEVIKLSAESNCRLVVIGVTPNEHEAVRIACHVRREWPAAKILLLGQASAFDDPLYDESVMPAGNPAGVVEAARRLLGTEPENVS